MNATKTLRILIAKPGLDGHDRGAKVVARALSNAGMEVIYSGLLQTPEQIVNTAIDEDVDAVVLSILSGAHNTIFARIMQLLRKGGRRHSRFRRRNDPQERLGAPGSHGRGQGFQSRHRHTGHHRLPA